MLTTLAAAAATTAAIGTVPHASVEILYEYAVTGGNDWVHATSVGADGTVFGQAVRTHQGVETGFVIDQNGYRELAQPQAGLGSVSAWARLSDGRILGGARDQATGALRNVYWNTDGSVAYGGQLYITSVNAHGDLVGIDQDQPGTVFLTRDGVTTDLPAFAGSVSGASPILNDAGRVAATIRYADGTAGVGRYTGGSWQTLGFGENVGYASSIGADGTIAATSIDANTLENTPLLWAPGADNAVGIAGFNGADYAATQIGADGSMLVSLFDSDLGAGRYILHSNTFGEVELTSLVDLNFDAVVLAGSDTIVVTYYVSDPETLGVSGIARITIVPAPAALALLALGATLRRRR